MTAPLYILSYSGLADSSKRCRRTGQSAGKAATPTPWDDYDALIVKWTRLHAQLDPLPAWPGPPRTAPPRDVLPLVRHFLRPALHLQRFDGPSRSWLGGEPQLPVGTTWPKGDKGPLDFVARLSLAEMQASLPVPWLQAEGSLLFFHDRGDWGRSPKSRANHVVLLVDDLENPQVSTATEGSGRRQRHIGGNVRPVLIQTLPPVDDPLLEPLDLRDDESDAYVELQDIAFGDAPRHQFRGYDDPIQCAGMQSDCEAMANGHRDVEPAVAAQRWELLLQLDDDEAIGFSWVDAGRLYFWVEPERAALGDFSNVWRMLQCH